MFCTSRMVPGVKIRPSPLRIIAVLGFMCLRVPCLGLASCTGVLAMAQSVLISCAGFLKGMSHVSILGLHKVNHRKSMVIVALVAYNLSSSSLRRRVQRGRLVEPCLSVMHRPPLS
jgi:hypothetical protein